MTPEQANLLFDIFTTNSIMVGDTKPVRAAIESLKEIAKGRSVVRSSGSTYEVGRLNSEAKKAERLDGEVDILVREIMILMVIEGASKPNFEELQVEDVKRVREFVREIQRRLDSEFVNYAKIAGLDPDDLDGHADPLGTACAEVRSVRAELHKAEQLLKAAQDHASRLHQDLAGRRELALEDVSILCEALAPGELINLTDAVGRATAYRKHSAELNAIDCILRQRQVSIDAFPWDVAEGIAEGVTERVTILVTQLNKIADAVARVRGEMDS